jgi:4-amino-4-deoxy-L-arabinose transferase-like glycosyltransferase
MHICRPAERPQDAIDPGPAPGGEALSTLAHPSQTGELARDPLGEKTLRRSSTAAIAQRLALVAVLALSAVLNTHRLAQNGYANIFYSAGVKSMLGSLHDFLYVSFDPGGMIAVDKPPLGLWLQVASAKLFGFSPLSLLLPEAIAGVLAVAALYWATKRAFGPLAALAGALALAVFPSFVAVSRDNNLDALLILLMILACGVAVRAVQSGRWRTLLGCAVLIGLAFNTKTLAAYLIVPGIGLAYAVGAPGSPSRRASQLLAAGAVMLVVSFAWIAMVELTPASQRPYVGGSLNNTELGLTFEYNGLGRVGGEIGGPGHVPVVPLRPHAPPHDHGGRAPADHVHHRPLPSLILPDGRFRSPVTFGGATGPLRLFDTDLGDQGAWMLPFALLGLVALALSLLLSVPEQAGDADLELRADPRTELRADIDAVNTDTEGPPGRRKILRGRRDPRLAGLLIFGGWFLAEYAVLSSSKGIVHPYYISALGPGAAAMIGAGAFAFVNLAQLRERPLALASLVLLPIAVSATVFAQGTLLNRVSRLHYMDWLTPLLVVGATVGVLCFLVFLIVRRQAAPAMALILAVLLIAPGAYAATTWETPVEGTFPAAGPQQNVGYGGLDVLASTVRLDRSLIYYLGTHGATRRWTVLSEASDTAAPMILLGSRAGALGGYSADDPTMTAAALARLVARGEARYVVLGGAYSTRGGNAAINAVPLACAQVPGEAWGQTAFTPYSLALYDCAGRERQLARA